MATRAQQATRDAILAAAADAFAASDAVSMARLAATVGISRGTLYRYFPTRRALRDALQATALEETGRRLADAKLDRVAVEEALARAVRALVALDKTYLFLAREPHLGRQAALVEPINALLERGRKHGEIRDDIPLACLVETLLALIGACIRSGRTAAMGPEDVSLTVLRLFLSGARQPPR